MKNDKTINEDGSAFVSSANIAARTDRVEPTARSVHRREIKAGDRESFGTHTGGQLSPEGRANLATAKERARKKRSIVGRFKSFIGRESVDVVIKTPFKLNENFNMQDIVSRLKGIEHASAPDKTTSYGIEDDEGNMMKVTVKSENAKDFEAALAAEMAEAQDYKRVTGEGKNVSMAELLFKLKNSFEIVDVQFPSIPKDAIYNADKVSYGADSGTGMDGGMDPMAGPDGADPNMGDPMAGGDPMAAGHEGGDLGMDPAAGGDPMAADGDLGMGGDEEMMDDPSVQDFGEENPPEEVDEKSLLVSILNMLKADSEAKTAQANAEAEKARALQAEFSTKAASQELSKQEEIARMEAQMDRQKESQKDAKRMADIAKYRVNSIGESKKVSFGKFFLTEDEFDSVAGLQKKKQLLRSEYQASPDDDAETVQYKRSAFMMAVRVIDAQIRLAGLRDGYKKKQEAKNAAAGQKPQQNQAPNQQNTQNQQNGNHPAQNQQQGQGSQQQQQAG